MRPSELEQFLKAQANMSARIAKKAERAKGIAMAYSAQGGDRASNFARKVVQSLVRPGVAPGQRPKSKTGAETFHFDVTAINRTSDFTRAQTGSRIRNAFTRFKPHECRNYIAAAGYDADDPT